MREGTIYHSPIGKILLLTDGKYLIGSYFEGQKHYPKEDSFVLSDTPLPILESAKKWLDVYFSVKDPDFWVPIKLRGKPFQAQVWSVLTTIPYGETRTYGQIAKLIYKDDIKGLARAVGQAVGCNPISIFVPCHRVIGATSLGGYAGGIERKRYLLKLEGII